MTALKAKMMRMFDERGNPRPLGAVKPAREPVSKEVRAILDARAWRNVARRMV